jgi:hypothetical protein
MSNAYIVENGSVVVKVQFNDTEIQSYFDQTKQVYKVHHRNVRTDIDYVFQIELIEDVEYFMHILIRDAREGDIKLTLHHYDNDLDITQSTPMSECIMDASGNTVSEIAEEIANWIDITAAVY